MVVFTAVVGAIAVCIASPQVHGFYGQLADGFIHEELDSIRDFVRQPTWAGLRAGVQVGWAEQQQPGRAQHPLSLGPAGTEHGTCVSPQEAWAIIGPGGRLHPGWFLEHKGHLVVEGLLIVIIAVMLLQSRFSPKATEDEEGLTEKVWCTASMPSTEQQTELPATGWQAPAAATNTLTTCL